MNDINKKQLSTLLNKNAEEIINLFHKKFDKRIIEQLKFVSTLRLKQAKSYIKLVQDLKEEMHIIQI